MPGCAGCTDSSVSRFGFGAEPFVSHNCPVKNCYVTADRSLLPSLAHFDALLFHARDMDRRVIQVRGTAALAVTVMRIYKIRFPTKREEQLIRFMFSF